MAISRCAKAFSTVRNERQASLHTHAVRIRSTAKRTRAPTKSAPTTDETQA
jgi:hypothetical protein